MQFRSFVLATVLATALCSGPSRVSAASSEEAIETSTTAVRVPRTVGGSLMARPCRECAQLIVRLAADTRFFLGKRQVTLPELARVLADGTEHSLVVFYDRDAHTITRIVVSNYTAQRSTGGRS